MMSHVLRKRSLTVRQAKSAQAAACSRSLRPLAWRSALGTVPITPCVHESELPPAAGGHIGGTT